MTRTKLAAVAALALLARGASAQEMVFTSWGGTTQDAQTDAWATPFTATTGTSVVQDGPTDYGKLKAMVETGNMEWDLTEMGGADMIEAVKNGWLTEIDWSIVDPER